MKENIKLWLTQLFSNELNEVRGTIKNEHLFALGSYGDESLQHESNIEELREYAEILETYLRDVGVEA